MAVGDIHSVNLDTLMIRYGFASLLDNARHILRLSDERRHRLLRDHSVDDDSWIRPHEIPMRVGADALLGYMSILEIGMIAGILPQNLPHQTRGDLKRFLEDNAVREYYEVHYPLLLPQVFRERLGGRAFEPMDEESSFILFFDLVELDLRRHADKDLILFLDLLDDYNYDGVDIHDFVNLLKDPEKLIKETSRPPKEATTLSRAALGFESFIVFCRDLDCLLRRAQQAQLLQSAMWHYHAYWFDIVAEDVHAAMNDALANVSNWYDGDYVSAEERRHGKEAIAQTRDSFDRLADPRHYGTRLRVAWSDMIRGASPRTRGNGARTDRVTQLLASELTPNSLGPALAMADIQGDILVGLQKNAEALQLFRITDAAAFRRFVAQLPLTSAQTAFEREQEIKKLRTAGSGKRLDTRGLNIGFTHAGLVALELEGAETLADEAFVQGLAARGDRLADPEPGSWNFATGSDPIHGVFVVTGDDLAEVAAQFRDHVNATSAGFATVGEPLVGHTRPARERGHEHFGFKDGVSQPGVRGTVAPGVPLTERKNPQAPDDQGNPGQDLLWPGEFVFGDGYPGQTAGDDFTEPGEPAAPPRPWMANGAFLVVRKLAQLVPEMHRAVADAAGEAGLERAQLEAQMVGRFKSGTPVLNLIGGVPTDDPALAEDYLRNNDFKFGDDRQGLVCPWAAHIRKTYPRDDVRGNVSPGEADVERAEAFTQTHRMLRRGIPFGHEVELFEHLTGRTHHERGLIFKCYCTNIAEQFEFIQQTWANNPDFVQPGGQVDPIIGQVAGGGARPWADAGQKQRFEFQPWVQMKGGGYFFAPAIGVLKSLV